MARKRKAYRELKVSSISGYGWSTWYTFDICNDSMVY